MKKHFLTLLLFGIGAAAFAAADPDGLVAAYDFADAQDGFVRDYGPNCNVGYINNSFEVVLMVVAGSAAMFTEGYFWHELKH